MKRVSIQPREGYKEKLEALSFEFHSLENVYWDESAAYQFSMAEILALEKATNELFPMCLLAVQHVIDNALYDKLHINSNLIPLIERSWNEEEPSVYGRFDFGFDGTEIKLFEFNADTPTSLYEASVIQWYWLQDYDKTADQFNSMHEKLIQYWSGCKEYFNGEIIHFSCVRDSIEDFTTVEYMRDTAHQAGLNTKFIYISDIGWAGNKFTDLQDVTIQNIFKLYPYEWLSNEEFGNNLGRSSTRWIEPAWKSILSNKGILPILWEMYPNHPLLLECYFDSPHKMKSYVRKPIYSREGANIQMVVDGTETAHTDGEYGEEGYIYQALYNLPETAGNCPVIGSWVIGGESAGIGIRESNTIITDNFSRFIPHFIKS